MDENTYELVEFNCPILGISVHYSEACRAESDMFRSTTDAEIAVEALNYIEKELGREHVVNLLRLRTGKMVIPYRKNLEEGTLV